MINEMNQRYTSKSDDPDIILRIPIFAKNTDA